jgi:Spy/CpxP family protein refolding chaperone
MKKTLFFLFAAMLLASSMTMAQQGRGGGVEQRVQRLKDSLSLSDKQTEQIKAIYTASQEQMQKDRDSLQGDRAAMQKVMTARNAAADSLIVRLLTPDQKKKYLEIQEQRRKQREERMRNQNNN